MEPQREGQTDLPRAGDHMICEAPGQTGFAKRTGSDGLGHAAMLHNVAGNRKGLRYSPDADSGLAALHNVDMAEQPQFPNHVRAWREFRHLTQDELAEAAGCSRATIGHIEGGVRRLSDKWAHPIAKALNTSAGYLMDHDPNDLPTAILDVWAEIPVESRGQALKVLESFKRTGTEG